VVNIGHVDSISRVIISELMATARVEVFNGIAAATSALQPNGMVANKDKEVSSWTVWSRVIETAVLPLHTPADLHTSQEFIIDGQDGVREPSA